LHAHYHHWHFGGCPNVALLHPASEESASSRSTDDLSSKTLAVLAAGLALSIGYGILKSDFVIIVANAVGFLLVATLIGFKIRDAG
jgi:MtN3 and saliva related transmembrane protein